MDIKFFQNEKKFIVGNNYSTLKVNSPRYTGLVPIEKCDEVGTIIPNTELVLGKYVKSEYYGYGDGGGRCDTFINNDGLTITHYLDYYGTTRYREITSLMDVRVKYLSLVEGLGENKNIDNKNEHTNKYLLNEEIKKEVCSFMNTQLK